MIGAIIGDIVGSVYEFDNYCAKDFQPFFHRRARITDDTVCTIALADALLRQQSPESVLKSWCTRYWQIGGWGVRFGAWVQGSSLAPYGSFGNGAAMRVSSAAFLASSEEEAIELATKLTEITHDHPEGIKGACATALSIYLAFQGVEPSEIRNQISLRFGYDLNRSVSEIRAEYVYSESCQKSVPEALTCALEATDFEDAIRNAISIGGDSDTIAAIAGGVAEARFGIPTEISSRLPHYLPDEMREVLEAMYLKRKMTIGEVR